MSINDDFQNIIDSSHYWNWAPDWMLAQKIYNKFPDSFSILTPFTYSYLEETIRSNTSEYGRELLNVKTRKVGNNLISLAIKENFNNKELVKELEYLRKYFVHSTPLDKGNNRNSVDHGYMHPLYWTKESFEELLHDTAEFSKKFSGF